MPRINTEKILDALQGAGLIESFTKNTYHDELRDVFETRYKVESSRLSVSHEIYGRDACMYFQVNDENDVQPVREVLAGLGYSDGSINDQWNGADDRGTFEIPVMYFKGSRWWE